MLQYFSHKERERLPSYIYTVVVINLFISVYMLQLLIN
jgi:hypothetical protein